MLNAEVLHDQNLVIARPEGSLDIADFDALAKTIDGYINQHDQIPSLVIEADKFPHWASFDALMHHMKLVKEHQKIIPKVAVISDAHGLSALPSLVNHFVKAEIRHFPKRHKDEALKWAASADAAPGGFEELEEIASNVIAVRGVGIITAQAYSDTLRPLIDKKLETHDHINLLMVFDDDFQSYTGGAMWSDARLGLSHFTSFDKIALVTDVESFRIGMKMAGPFIPAKIHVFHTAELDDAKLWIKR